MIPCVFERAEPVKKNPRGGKEEKSGEGWGREEPQQGKVRSAKFGITTLPSRVVTLLLNSARNLNLTPLSQRSFWGYLGCD